MQTGNLVKHITQDKWGIIVNIIDFSKTDELDHDWIEILWYDQCQTEFIWDDLLKVVK